MVREPDELVAAGQALARGGDQLRFQPGLQPVGDGLAVALLERLERDRDSLVALLSEDLDVGAHAGPEGLGQLVERDLDLEDLDLFDELGGRRDEADFPGEDLLRIGVEGDPRGLTHVDLGDIHLVQVHPDDERLQVRDGEENGAGVEGGDARCHRLAELDPLLDDDARHRRGHPRVLGGGVAGDRDAPVLDDLVAHAGRLERFDRLFPLVLHALEGVAAEEPLVEKRLLGSVTPLRVLELQLRLRQRALGVREGLRLVDVRLDLGQHVAVLDDGALAHAQRQDPPRDGRLDVHLGDRVHNAHLPHGHLQRLLLDFP